MASRIRDTAGSPTTRTCLVVVVFLAPCTVDEWCGEAGTDRCCTAGREIGDGEYWAVAVVMMSAPIAIVSDPSLTLPEGGPHHDDHNIRDGNRELGDGGHGSRAAGGGWKGN